MKRLPVDVEEIAAMMDRDGGMGIQGYYLDTETGDIVVIPEELLREEVLEDAYAGGLPAWERDLVPAARDIYQDGDRYVAIPAISSGEIYDLMVEFAESVRNQALGEKLSIALDGRGAFGRFKRVLAGYPAERERWYKMKDAFLAEQVREWLADWDVEASPKEP